MLEGLSAEALKMRTHKATWFLIWIFPIAFTGVFICVIIAGMAGLDPPEHAKAADWVEMTSLVWFLPGNPFGRYLVSAFVAVVFAGEYGWNTWKLIVPHRRRASLIGAKYALVVLLIVASFALTAALSTGLNFADGLLTADPIPPEIGAAMLWHEHWTAALSALAPVLVAIGYASLAAVLTRSTIAALVVAIVATTIEEILFKFGPPLYLHFPSVVWPLYHVLPGHHLANLTEFIRRGGELSREFPGGQVVHFAWTTSLGILLAWVAALWGATWAVFGRQDIN